jgi:hypothetical protein
MRCSCGRVAEWKGDLSGEPECFELIDLRRHENDDRIIWKSKYPGEKARHEVASRHLIGKEIT